MLHPGRAVCQGGQNEREGGTQTVGGNGSHGAEAYSEGPTPSSSDCSNEVQMV
jgi:hypothetical protein